MNNSEFNGWLADVQTRFPQMRKFLADMDSKERGDTSLFWFEKLKSFDASTAHAAMDVLFESSKRLFASDWFAAYYGTIRGVSSERKRETRLYDGEVLNECRHGCTLDGFVPILNHPMRAGQATYVACACGKGEPHASRGMYRFDPNRDKHADQPHVTTNWKTQGDV